MKNTFFHVSRATVLAVCAIATSQAQTSIVPTLSVTVPFDFVVSGKTLPSGSYNITHTNSIGGASMFIVRNLVTRTSAISRANGRTWPRAWSKESDPKTAQVLFACREEICYMKELKIPGWDGYLITLPKLSPAQQERHVALKAGFLAIGK